MPPMPDITWTGAQAVSKLLGISRSKAQAMAKAGELRPAGIGKAYRFSMAEVMA